MDRTHLIRCAQQRAHIAGADAVILEKEANAMLAQAHKARQLYFRELEAIDILTGNSPSPFAQLGQ